MRLKKSIETIGYFWLPENAEQKLPGTLKISEVGKINLEVIGQFGDTFSYLTAPQDVKRIIGLLEEGGYVTLDKCQYSSRSHSLNGISKSTIYVGFALIGVGYDVGEEITFSRVRFSLEGLDEWLNISGIKMTLDYENLGVTLDYKSPENISYSLPDGIQMHFEFSHSFPSPKITGARISQKVYVSLASDRPKPFDFFSKLIFRLTRFFCFALDETVTQDSVTGFSHDFQRQGAQGKLYDTPLDIYYESLPFSESAKNFSAQKMLFNFDHVKGNADLIFARWLQNYDVSEPAFNLYFAANSGGHRYLEGKYLSLAQGVETLHRRNSRETLMEKECYQELTMKLIGSCPSEHKDWLAGKLRYGNELPLRTRLRQMISPFHRFFGNAAQQKYLISKILDTRNYLTHYDPELEKSAAKYSDLWELCIKLECLFQLHFLDLIGLRESEIDQLVSSNQRMTDALKNRAE